MGRKIALKDVSAVLDEIEYPVERTAAAATLSDVTLVLADGTPNLGDLVAETAAETFDSAADIESELNNVLPRGAVGEPYQSEGSE